jgi:hypothetical protein
MHTHYVTDLTFKGIIFASSGKHKIEISIDGKDIVTFFTNTMDTKQIALNLKLTNSSINVRVQNMDNLACDHHITYLLEDHWDKYSAQFDQELEKTLTI